MKRALFALLVWLAFGATAPSQDKAADCSRRLELAPQPKPSKEEEKKAQEEQRRAKELRAQGSIAISISEQGDVTEAKVVRASSDEGGKLLLTRAKAMKFRARPGCGTFKTVVNFTLP